MATKGGEEGREGGIRCESEEADNPPPPHFLSKTHRCSTLPRRGRTERRASVRNGGEDLSLHPCETNKRSLWHFTGSEQTCGLPTVARELLCSSLLRERPRGFFFAAANSARELLSGPSPLRSLAFSYKAAGRAAQNPVKNTGKPFS